MKNGLLYMFLLLFVAMSSQHAFSQREFGEGQQGSIPQVILHPTITHATCFDPTAGISYYIEVANGWIKGTKVNRLDLYDENWENPISLTGNGCCGTISNLTPGMYTFYGSMTVVTSTGMLVSVPLNYTVWLGMETVWAEKIDMISFPNSFSAKRNVATVDYGGVRSSNRITSGDGWIEMKAVYGSTNDNRVFLMIGDNSLFGTFDPSATIQYVEFYKGSSGSGIRLKYQQFLGGPFLMTTLSTDPDDKIRLIRTGSTLTIQKNNSATAIFTLPVAYSGPMNIVSRSLALNDGCLDVVSSFLCKTDKNIYAKIERNLQGVRYEAENGLVKFYVTEEYNNQSPNLIYKVYSETDRMNPVNIGTQSFPIHKFGDNRYDLNVSTLASGAYILAVENEKKEKFYLRFIKQ